MSNGVHVLQALSIVERTVGNVVIGEELRKARDRVTDGTTISGPLAASKVFPVILTDMLAIGEQTGDMPTALMHIARRYESELDRNIKIFTTALEPILIVVVAVLVGFVAISILMAVFSLTNGLDV
jgi:type II secretory pathway component PulF